MDNNTKKPKRIGIDARFYGPVGKGLGRYTQEIVDNILAQDQENEYVIFLGRENFDAFVCPNPRVNKVLADVRWYTLAEQVVFPYLIFQAKLDLIHFTHFNVPVFCPAKFIVTIHDLILIRFPTTRATTLGPLMYRIKNWGYKLVISMAVRRARRIIAVSEFTKRDIMDHFRVSEEKLVVTREGVSDFLDSGAFSQGPDQEAGWAEAEKALSGYGISGRYLLYVGNAYPHKNLEGLLELFKDTKMNKAEFGDIKLVLVGKEDYFYRRVKDYAWKLGLTSEPEGGSVVFPGYVPDAHLKLLYKQAIAYIFPSLYEGFGLPPLEAMSYGCPVLSSDQASMPEILGKAALYFDPRNREDGMKKIRIIISDKGLRQQLIGSGYEQIKKYSWKECARQTMAAYLLEL